MIDKIKFILELSESWCADQDNGLTDGQVCLSALKDIRRVVREGETFKYNLNQKVRVQVFISIKTGVIVKRSSYETNLGINFKYTVKYGEGHGDYLDVWEKDLHLLQKLPYVGEI